MLEKIVAPLDGSALADMVLPHLIALTQINGTTVTLLHVVEGNQASTAGIDPVEWALRKSEAEAYLQETAQRLQHFDLTTQEVVLEGNAADRIVDYAQQADVDLIALTSHGRSGLNHWNLSSVVQKVIQRARKSVLFIPTYCDLSHGNTTDSLDPVHYRRILVPLDGSPRAECILPLAEALARYHKAELFLGHVVTRPELVQRMPLSEEDQKLAAEIATRNRTEITRYFEQLQGRLAPKPTTTILEEENIERALLDFVHKEAIDLVLLTAHGHSGHNERPYGRLATGLIAYGGVPLYIHQDFSVDEIEPLFAERMLQTLKPPQEHRFNTYEYAIN